METLDRLRTPPDFPPTLEAAQARLAAVRPAAYARTRNALDGAVTRLSPYLTHGLLDLPQVLRALLAREALPVQHKLVYELGWRAYFRHVWAARGAGILGTLHEGPLPASAYADGLPPDLRAGRTGVPAIDRAVRMLYAQGWLHNHARMWLASYTVHLRKVHWRAGADWMFAHLLDGDLASNHLSWQWVAGTASQRPYLFNADNVARYAPPDWHSAATPIDCDYATLEAIARSPHVRGATANAEGIDEPACSALPPAALGALAPSPDAVHGREVWLVHPWNLGALPDDLPRDALVLGVLVEDFHRAWPWSAQRWAFVAARMAALTHTCWFASAEQIGAALCSARRVRSRATPHLAPWLAQWAQCEPEPTVFPHVEGACASFSQWWRRVTHGLSDAHELLDAARPAHAPRARRAA